MFNFVCVLFIVPDDVESDEPADECELRQSCLDLLISECKPQAPPSSKDVEPLFAERAQLGLVRCVDVKDTPIIEHAKDSVPLGMGGHEPINDS